MIVRKQIKTTVYGGGVIMTGKERFLRSCRKGERRPPASVDECACWTGTDQHVQLLRSEHLA